MMQENGLFAGSAQGVSMLAPGAMFYKIGAVVPGCCARRSLPCAR
ncbi:hypothetical protein A2U01_0107338, partial [Trifolium medium]|nr:hypothetical protein [Trifolium medium]